MKIIPYLNFNGQCEEAFSFYRDCLGGEIVAMLTHEAMGVSEHVPPGWADKIMHARLKVGDAELMASDAPAEHFEKPQGISVSLHIDDVGEAERVFDALSAGGAITMPMQQTEWAERFGMLVDRYGIPWMVNCEGSVRFER